MKPSAHPLESIFATAVEITSAVERRAFLDHACAGDAELRARVEEMLDNHGRAGSFLESLAPGLVATVAVPAVAELPGAVIGPYKLLQEIGEGGMGTVFFAEQTQPVQRQVALKLIKTGLNSRQVLARFEAERQALALMDHPNIAKVHDAGTTEGGQPFFVMELVKGVPITKYCDEHRLTPRQRLELLVPVCHAVQHAHQKGIIHRDLKPSNVLVAEFDGKPVPKVIDFGVAKATGLKLTERTLHTEFGAIVGTLEYMSPEQAEANQLDIDTRSDIYALGVLLYELLTGTTPLERKRLKEAALLEVLRIIREEEPPKLSTRLSTTEKLPSIAANRSLDPKRLSGLVRGELDWIAMKCLEKDRNRRYETASGLARDIEHYLHDQPVHACPPSAGYRFRKFVRRNNRMLATVGVVAFAALLAVGTLGWSVRDRAAREHEAARDQAARQLVLEYEVGRALEETEAFCQRDQLPQALAAVKRAEGLLAAGGGSEELQQRVRQWRTDLAMVERLQEIRLQGAAAVKDGKFDQAAAGPAYRQAFQQYGLDVEALDRAAAAERIRASALQQWLVAALDDWAMATGFDRTNSATLLAVSRQADADSWRDRFRDAFQRKDRKALQDLARNQEVLAQPPKTVRLLAQALVPIRQESLAIEVLRQAQQRYPGDFWINHSLALYLMELKPSQVNEAAGFYRAALALRPDSPGVHLNLGNALRHQGKRAEAEAEFREALRLQPDFAQAHNSLGNALHDQGKQLEAEAAYREALRLQPDYAKAHNGLGNALHDQGKQLEAEAAYREALRLQPNFADAHNGLGLALKDQGKPAEAEAEFREALRLQPDNAQAHNNLGNRLRRQGKPAEAEAEYRTALRLQPDYALAHNGLGLLLHQQGKLAEAEVEYRTALRLQPDYALAHNNLGNLLRQQGKLAEAEAEYRTALRIQPDYADAHCNLGRTLQAKGQLREALAALKKGHQLGSKRPGWSNPSARWVAECERLLELEPRLPPVINGVTRPKDVAEQIEFARLCALKQLPVAAARLYQEALTANPKQASVRFRAATAAALAGCGTGEDAAGLDDHDRARWRQQAHDWLRAELDRRRKQLESNTPPARQAAEAALKGWKRHSDWAGLRDADALDKLPEAERPIWQKLWVDVDAVLRAARPDQPGGATPAQPTTEERIPGGR